MEKYKTYLTLLVIITCKIVSAQQNSPKQITLHIPDTPVLQRDSIEIQKEKLSDQSLNELCVFTVSMPLTNYSISSGFGWRTHPATGKPSFHNGIDLAASAQVVHSILPGTVESTGYHEYLGKFVRVDHGFVHSIYGHLSRITVINGQYVPAGFPIGITGNTGRTTGEHLHFSIRRKNIYLDPLKFLHALIQSMKN